MWSETISCAEQQQLQLAPDIGSASDEADDGFTLVESRNQQRKKRRLQQMSGAQQSERQISHQPTASAVTQEPSRSQVIQPQPVTDKTANRQRQRQRFDSFRRPLVVGK